MGESKESQEARKTRRKRLIRIGQGVLSAVIAVAIFALVIPKIANYGAVWKALGELTPAPGSARRPQSDCSETPAAHPVAQPAPDAPPPAPRRCIRVRQEVGQ